MAFVELLKILNKEKLQNPSWHLRPSRPPVNDSWAPTAVLHPQRVIPTCKSDLYVHWYICFVHMSQLLPNPFPVLKWGKQFLPYQLPRVVLSMTKDRCTQGHLEKRGALHRSKQGLSTRQQQEATASWGLSGSCRRPLPNIPKCSARSCSWAHWCSVSIGTSRTTGGCTSSKHLS